MGATPANTNLIYGPAYLARGLFVAAFVPITVMAMQWRHDSELEIPEFTIVWFAAWICTLLLTITLPLRRWAVYCLHWLLYLGAASLLMYDWRTAYLWQGLFSLVWWAQYDAFERLYRGYKAINESVARAKVLEARIRPHFVFNVFNSLRALSESGSVVARALDDGADLLRAALVRTGPFVAYCDERALVEQYLRLEFLRLSERLQVIWRVDEEVEDENPWMPGFILQPVVENAIRYGIERHGGEVTIELRHIQAYMQVVITNVCSETPTKSSPTGLGLAETDIKERLILLYDAHAHYERKYVNGRCEVTIRFPWKHQ